MKPSFAWDAKVMWTYNIENMFSFPGLKGIISKILEIVPINCVLSMKSL